MPMADDLPEWTIIHVPAYLRFEAGSETDDVYIPYIRRDEGKPPFLTPEEEESRINEQINESEGFDINFEEFRNIFNYRPLNLDDNSRFVVMPPDTTRPLMNSLSSGSLERYNETKGTKYEFVRVIKANFHTTGSPAIMYFITFQGKEPSHDEPQTFQAKVCYFFYDSPLYISYDLKPHKNVHSIETAEKEGVKKPRLLANA